MLPMRESPQLMTVSVSSVGQWSSSQVKVRSMSGERAPFGRHPFVVGGRVGHVPAHGGGAGPVELEEGEVVGRHVHVVQLGQHPDRRRLEALPGRPGPPRTATIRRGTA
jgi:hypothetical protein